MDNCECILYIYVILNSQLCSFIFFYLDRFMDDTIIQFMIQFMNTKNEMHTELFEEDLLCYLIEEILRVDLYEILRIL